MSTDEQMLNGVGVVAGQAARSILRIPAAARLGEIARIIEAVDNRCMASDGPVTPTLSEMTQDEISRIYALASCPVLRTQNPDTCPFCADGDEPFNGAHHDKYACGREYPEMWAANSEREAIADVLMEVANDDRYRYARPRTAALIAADRILARATTTPHTEADR
jgi:hypothetical protein